VTLNVPPALSIEDAIVSEPLDGVAFAALTLRLSHPPTESVTVSYRTQDATARVAEGDYEAVDGQVIFHKGEVEKSIKIAIRSDDRAELIEDFNVVFTAQNVRVPKPGAVAKISVRDSGRPKIFLSTIDQADLAQPIHVGERLTPGQTVYLWANLAKGDAVITGSLRFQHAYPKKLPAAVSISTSPAAADGQRPVLLASLVVQPLDNPVLFLSDEPKLYSLVVVEPIELLSGAQYFVMDGAQSQLSLRLNGAGLGPPAVNMQLTIERPNNSDDDPSQSRFEVGLNPAVLEPPVPAPDNQASNPSPADDAQILPLVSDIGLFVALDNYVTTVLSPIEFFVAIPARPIRLPASADHNETAAPSFGDDRLAIPTDIVSRDAVYQKLGSSSNTGREWSTWYHPGLVNGSSPFYGVPQPLTSNVPARHAVITTLGASSQQDSVAASPRVLSATRRRRIPMSPISPSPSM
jgi:hypothetical protein